MINFLQTGLRKKVMNFKVAKRRKIYFFEGSGINFETSFLYFAKASGLFFSICLSFIGIEAKRNINSMPIEPIAVYQDAPKASPIASNPNQKSISPR